MASAFLKLTLKGKRDAAKVAAALGLHPGIILWGLAELWEYVWERRTDAMVSAITLAACLGPDTRIPEALAAFGFLEKMGDDWRVCGAETYLQISEARSRAGRRGAEVAGRSKNGKYVGTGKTPANDRHPDGQSTVTAPALTPSTQHPAPRSLEETDMSAGADEYDLNALAVSWNERTSPPIPRCERIPPDRRKRMKAALKRRPLEEWRKVFSLIEASAFCRGATGWTADFDWAIRPAGVKPEPAGKLLEGGYANHATTGPPRVVDVTRGRVAAESQDHLHKHGIEGF